MDRTAHSRLPFLLAFFVGLFNQPLDIYAFNRQNVGTEVLSPWQRGTSAVASRVKGLCAAILSVLRSPGFRFGLVAAMLLMAVTGHLHAEHAVLVAGLTDPKDIREQINKLGTDMRSITEKCRTETREMTAEEESSFDKMDTDREKLLATEARLLKVASMEEGEGRRVAPRQIGESQTAQRGKVTAEDQLEGMRAWLLSGTEVGLNAQQRAAAAKLGINPESKRMALRLPARAMRSLRPSEVEAYEKRALSTLTTTSPEDGSYLIANELILPLERALLTYGGVRQVATVRRTLTGANLPIPTSDDTSNEGALLAENSITVEKDTEFGQLVLGAFKFTSKKVLVSMELMQDSATDLAEFLGSALGERIGRITNRYGTTGTGSSEPKGIVTAATSSGVTLAAKTPTYLELVAIEGSVDPAYRVGAGWMFPDSELQEIKKIVESTTGRPIWLPNMAGGAPDSILGYPYTINQHMDAAAATGSGKSILFGLLSKYIWRDVRDVMLLRLDELYAEYGQVAFLAFSRMDGDLLDAGTHPVKYAANHA
jgi:HK97 family phage major capsid protein